MVNEHELRRHVGAVRDAHLPFGLDELGMLEQLTVSASGAVQVVVNVPCHHCPGLQMMEHDIHLALRSAGVQEEISVSFQGRKNWTPSDIAPQARSAMMALGIQSIVQLPARSRESA